MATEQRLRRLVDKIDQELERGRPINPRNNGNALDNERLRVLWTGLLQDI